MVKNPATSAGDARDMCSVPGWEGLLKEGVAIQSSILAWGKSWIEEPGGLQFIGLDMTECMRARARAHTHTHTHTHTPAK